MYSIRIPSVLAKEVIRLSSSAAIADFAKLFPDPSQTYRKLSDVVLVSGDNVEFHVHKNILACRSPFFGTLFTGEYADSETPRMQFDFVQSDVLETILKFIYGHGKIEISTNLDNKTSKLIEIATAANMLLMDDLQHQVLNLLESNINKANVIEVIRFARDIGEAGAVLKNACFNSLKKAELTEIVEFLLDGGGFMQDMQASAAEAMAIE